jgi:hypothetical protein
LLRESAQFARVKDKIKQWLKEKSHDRQWLADQIGVSKRTVDGWLSSNKPMPRKVELLLERLLTHNTGHHQLLAAVALLERQIARMEQYEHHLPTITECAVVADELRVSMRLIQQALA